jgi:hypothetical protein
MFTANVNAALKSVMLGGKSRDSALAADSNANLVYRSDLVGFNFLIC